MSEFVPPPRDSFGLALSALRLRLRHAVDAPGAPIPINLIAQELRLSPTPVREALSRLAGEDLVDKQGHAYTRPKLDGQALAELYNLRWLYVAHARAPTRPPGDRLLERPKISFVSALAQGAGRAGEVIEGLMREEVLAAGDLVLAQAYQRTAARLAPFQPVEDQLFGDVTTEALGLVHPHDAGDRRRLRQALRAYHRRRISFAPQLARLSEAAKYRPDIV